MFTMKIALGNAAMMTAHDVASALREVADRLELHNPDEEFAKADIYDRTGTIMDANGNRVGSWKAGRA